MRDEPAEYTTEAVREDLVQTSSWRFLHDNIGPAFDRWLAAHDAEVRASRDAEVAALEATIAALRDWATTSDRGTAQDEAEMLAVLGYTEGGIPPTEHLARAIGEAKAEEAEAISGKLAERNLLWWSRDQGPMVQIDEETGKKVTLDQWLAERAADHRNATDRVRA